MLGAGHFQGPCGMNHSLQGSLQLLGQLTAISGQNSQKATMQCETKQSRLFFPIILHGLAMFLFNGLSITIVGKVTVVTTKHAINSLHNKFQSISALLNSQTTFKYFKIQHPNKVS